jgi:hypothetical protein
VQLELPFRMHAELIHKITAIEPLDSSFNEKLEKNYLNNSISNHNPLILDL